MYNTENWVSEEQLPPSAGLKVICKTDPNFPLKNETEDVDSRIRAIEEKIAKQDDLLQQSSELKKDLSQRIEVLDDSNSKQQMELLESLGSDI